MPATTHLRCARPSIFSRQPPENTPCPPRMLLARATASAYSKRALQWQRAAILPSIRSTGQHRSVMSMCAYSVARCRKLCRNTAKAASQCRWWTITASMPKCVRSGIPCRRSICNNMSSSTANTAEPDLCVSECNLNAHWSIKVQLSSNPTMSTFYSSLSYNPINASSPLCCGGSGGADCCFNICSINSAVVLLYIHIAPSRF